MTKIISLTICLLIICAYTKANVTQNRNTDAHIIGHVVDKETGDHLPFATIKLQGTTIGIMTDGTGHFFLRNLPIGNHILEVSMIGYRTETREVTITANTTQEVDFYLEEEKTMLDEVVVSASRGETTRRLAPSLVSVIGMRTLESTSSQTLADGLRFQSGLRVESTCANDGVPQVRINGLPGTYSQILIDSRPVVGALSGLYILEQIPANMIERIEVVRGGGSALFGANAIGGAVNIITREPLRNLGEFAHTISSLNDNTTSFNASLVNDTRSAGISAYGQHRLREAVDINGDGFSNLPLLKNRAFGFRSFLRTGLYSRLTMEYQNRHEFRRGGDQLDLQPYEAYIAEQLEHYTNGASLRFDHFANLNSRFALYSAFQHVKRNGYYGAGDPFTTDIPELRPGMSQEEIDNINDILENNEERMSSFGTTTELVYQVGGHYIRSFDHLWFMPADLTAGLEYTGSDLKDVSLARPMDISQRTGTAAAFLQNEWKTSMWSFLAGGRVDKHNLLDNAIFSPRATIRYNPQNNINLRLTYSEGFRAPQLTEDQLHINIVGGQQFFYVFSDDLREERSRSVSASVDYYHQIGNTRFNALAEGFYTRIVRPFTETVTGNQVIIENDDEGAAVYGVNLEGRMVYRTFDLQAGVTIQRALYDDEQKWWEPETPEEEALDAVTPTRRMMRTPNTYAYFVASWSPIKRFTTSLSGNYTGSMLVPHEAGFGDAGDRFSKVNITKKTPTFFELNLRLAYDFNLYTDTKLQLNAGVQNIFDAFQRDFDTGAGKAASYVYGPNTPRMFFAGVRLMF
ncbi:MAG: TonB-dependent receptor [Dysgonamonadaceae bacterium]|jgi:outer membrane receptor for ferrienterochelin and colicins|nr:TonB-dependent receptor [Dysgonamonadaceae bacterium]